MGTCAKLCGRNAFGQRQRIIHGENIVNMQNRRIFCGGTFCFDYRKKGYEVMAAKDYRAMLLDSVDALLKPKGTDEVRINGGVTYVGPFYFETKSMKAEDIISCEMEMIESCTDAIFLLDDAACPGTISEVMYANSLGKTLHLFYVCHKDDEETESELHTPCWYPILFCWMTNKDVNIYPCSNVEDAVCKVQYFVKKEKIFCDSSESIEPRAEQSIDMKENNHFGEI